ncbi:MAG: hypothetical protein LIO69_08585 [Oscillospiraceae bacterium]|nr:hypothetical protein [Oscillospiraceae bacterium]
MFGAKLNKEIIDLLCKMIGTNLVSIETGASEAEFSRSYGKIRINFNASAIELSNLEKPTPFLDSLDDISGFSCEIKDKDTPFIPYLDEEIHTIPINEQITEITIINDLITIPDCSYQIEFDEAIIIKTVKGFYMISRDWQYNEIIRLSKHCNYDDIYPIDQVIESWNNFGTFMVDVKRTKHNVKEHE